MQRFSEGPRAGLSTTQVEAILTGPLRGRAGCDLLDQDLNLVGDITDNLIKGSVGRVMNARIHGTAAMSFDIQFDWATDLFRPYTELWNPDYPENVTKWYRGVYAMSAPDDEAESDEVMVTGADRLYYLDRLIGESYEYPAGHGVLAAVRETLADAGVTGYLLDSSRETATLPRAMSWPLISEAGDFATWLSVINQLLATVGYRGMWVDEIGRYRSEPYINPLVRPTEYHFDASDTNPHRIVNRKRVRSRHLWARPNQWTFIQQNRPIEAAAPTVGDGIYKYTNQSTGPTSVDAVGRVWPRVERVDVADQAALISRTLEAAAQDMLVATQFKVTTGPFPAAWHADVLRYTDPTWGTTKVQAIQWSSDISAGDVTWTWEEVL